MNYDALFQTFRLQGLDLPNRIVMAPMTRSQSPGGIPGADVAAYYRRRAQGGVGLIITEGTTIASDVASNDPDVPNFHNPQALAGWREVAAQVHDAGTKIMPQLWHVGTMRRQGTGPHPEPPSHGPSGLFKPNKKVAEPMTQDEVRTTIQAYADGAYAAREAGFDGVELHGAHGYLIDQFFWSGTNKRDDAWGGDMVARTRFAADIVAAARRQVGPDFPILLRFSQWKQQDYDHKLAHTPDELAAFLAPLVAAGTDAFHCSTRRFWEAEFEGSPLNLAGWTKKLSKRPSITVGSVGLDGEFVAAFQGEASKPAPLDDLILRLQREEFDLVAVGRALLVDADWAIKVRNGDLDKLTPFTREALAQYA